MFLILSYKEYEEISTVKSGSRDQVKILTDILDFEDTKSAGLPGARLIILCAEHGTNLTGASPVTGIYRQV